MSTPRERWESEAIRLIFSDELPDDTPVSEIRRIAAERTGYDPAERMRELEEQVREAETNPRPKVSEEPDGLAHKNLPCLRCDRNLWVQSLTTYSDIQYVQCSCGLRYSADVLRKIDHEEWGQIIRRDGFEVNFEGDTAWVTRLAE